MMSQLFGRDPEIEAIAALLGAVEVSGSAVCVRGDAGIGKSALLRAAEQMTGAGKWTPLRTTGVQSEAHLPFAGLHQLLRPVRSSIAALPGPQRTALLVAFGELDGDAPNLYLIALATLSLLAEVASSRPVLVLVEDAQWLDQPTCDVLAFVGRRLASDRIVLLVALRDGYPTGFDAAGLTDMRLGGIDPQSAEQLLGVTAPGVEKQVLTRLIRESRGNPLALVELPKVIGHGEHADIPALAGALPLTERLERAFVSRYADLPAATQLLLLVASLDDGDDAAEVLAAAALVGKAQLTMDALEPAVAAGLIAIEANSVGFRHPLVRSAIGQSASVGERMRVHASLAAVLTADTDRHAWHRAASIVGPDDQVAGGLEAAADRARRRGAVETAVQGLERAAALSETPRERGRRILRAAGLAFELGRPEKVRSLLRDVAGLDLEPVERVRLTLLELTIDVAVPDDGSRVRSLVHLAVDMQESGHPDLALELLLAASYSCWWSDPGVALRTNVITAAESLEYPPSNPRRLAILANAAALERGSHVISELRRIDVHAVDDATHLRLLGQAAFAVGDFDVARRFLAVAVAGLRRDGRLGLLAQVLVLQAWLAIHVGDWSLARTAAEEAHRLSEETGQEVWTTGADVTRAMLAGLRGEHEMAESIASSAEGRAAATGMGSLLAGLIVARSRADLGAGRYDEAADRLMALFDHTSATFHYVQRGWAIGDLAEAARYAGRPEEAERVLLELDPIAVMTPSPRLAVAMSYARALLAEDRDAEVLFQAALRPDTTPWPFDLARVNLAYGTWLRRRRRLADSRPALVAAREAFDALGAVDWGDRARAELRASGIRSRPKAAAALDELTAQELQIAQLVAEGLSNREIGGRLYLSHRTVGSHLYRIFPKLGITSRSQLLVLLRGGDESWERLA